MKLLFLSNFYPPSHRGGYEQWCQEVALALRDQGHEVVVLTSRHGETAAWENDPPWVQRTFYLEMELAALKNSLSFFWGRKARQQHNVDQVRETIQTLQPDAVLVWGMWNLTHAIPAAAEALCPGRVVYYLGDYWPTLPNQAAVYWSAAAQSRPAALLKALLRPAASRKLAREKPVTLQFEHALFPTRFLQQELAQRGFAPPHTAIVPGAVDTSRYAATAVQRQPALQPIRHLLTICRVEEEKGVHTALLALAELHRRGHDQLRLTVVGPAVESYLDHLKALAAEHQISAAVNFAGPQPPDQIPAFYQAADLFLFTSIWPEPFGRVIIEAMAAGVAVVGAPVGGAAEILQDRHNALTFHPGDERDLARAIEELMDLPELKQELERNGRHTATSTYDLQRMASEIARYLASITAH